jgi:hypothetical protein
MATRSHTSFNKRQKELARQEKQRDKAAKRVQRKLDKNSPGYVPEADSDEDDAALLGMTGDADRPGDADSESTF